MEFILFIEQRFDLQVSHREYYRVREVLSFIVGPFITVNLSLLHRISSKLGLETTLA